MPNRQRKTALRRQSNEQLAAPVAHRKSQQKLPLSFESLEARRVLAPLFPTFIDGVFTLGDPTSPVPYALADTFKLETNPNASKTIYMDFDGHRSVNNRWGHDINFPAFDLDGNPAAFSDAELIEIQKTFQSVAEDFAAFDVNITTKDPGLDRIISNGPGDTIFGMRCVMTQEMPGFGGFGGIAILNSFGSTDDTPCFALNKGVNIGSMTVSHEVGHTFGLRHDGLGAQEYHPGIGTGNTSWGPIMGAPFFDTPGGANSVQWSRGEYSSSTNTEDDYQFIVNSGVDFKADDAGNTIGTARNLIVTNDVNVFDWGFITAPNDLDVFRFETGTGAINLRINPFAERPNLDISAQILNELGQVVASSNPAGEMFAEFTNLNLTQGIYYLRLDGVGNSNNENNDYGSTGFYTISGTVVEPIRGPTTIGETGITLVNSNWKTITLSKNYTNPIVVAGPAGRVGADPLTIRVRNVTRNSFQVRLDEWDYQDGIHGNETVSYMVMEAGTHVLSNGTVIEAGTTIANHRWSPVQFSDDTDFGAAPVVLTQISTVAEQDAATTRLRNVTSAGFSVRVQEEQASDFVHRNETISWIAISKGNGTQEGKKFEVKATPNEVTHIGYSVDFTAGFTSTPVFLANMQTFNGGDPATVRSVRTNAIRSRIFIEEERSFDQEIQHNAEVVGYVAIEPGLIVIPPQSPNIPQAISAVSYRNPDDPARLLAALELLKFYDSQHVALECACSMNGSCACTGCMSDFLSADNGGGSQSQNTPSLAAFVFGQSAPVTTPSNESGAEFTLPAVNSAVAAPTTSLTGATSTNDNGPTRDFSGTSVAETEEVAIVEVAVRV